MNLCIDASYLSSAVISVCDNYQQYLQKRDHLMSEYTGILL